ncbi:integrase [Herbaspirillum sp. Sphag1AN]|uniref:FAD-dependent oxidoreductase n=1 Tax=unclassified Herbaspirillum TaxID=2624150 RepID=UPI00161F58D1|nr:MULTISPECIES: FAD-dependent oxidoreductase [unclassified Herbaspirillum]MBB3214483.1 integrase [Herbaspirillum sp. Sphag1AN]MBB3247677.1 integrase [Herbaspirillum sp. Sphag64]
MKTIGPAAIVSEIRDESGKVRTVCNFSTLQIDPRIASALRDAFDHVFGHNSVETRRQAWRCIRKFSLCIRKCNQHQSVPFSKDILRVFRDWLVEQNLKGATSQSHFNAVKSIVLWLSRNVTGIVSTDLIENVPSFPRDDLTKSVFLDEEIIKKILAAAYKEINEVSIRIEFGRRLLRGEYIDAREQELADLLTELLSLDVNRLFPTQQLILRTGRNLIARVQNAGGIRNLSKTLYLGPNDIFLFYLVIVVQCSGNPMAILSLKRDCLRFHPLRSDREFVVWSKPRAKREQKADFSNSRPHSAPNVIRSLLAQTEELVPFAVQADRKMLFLAYTNQGVRVPCFQLFHMMLAAFIERNNLPNFDFKQLRKSGGLLHHQAGGNILFAKERLGHVSTSTTRRYTEQNLFREQNDRLILKFQGEFVRTALQDTQIGDGEDGPADLCRKIAASIGPDRILLNTPVRSINVGDGHVDVEAKSTYGRYRAVLCAVPPPAVRKIQFSPPRSTSRERLLQALPMGRVIKIQVVYQRPYWRERGFSGQVMSNSYPLSYTIDNSPADGQRGVLAAFVCTSKAKQFMDARTDRRAIVAAAINQMFGCNFPAPEEVLVEDWAANEWIGGSYGAYFPPGVMTRMGELLREQEPPIYWCGAEYGQAHPCQIEGALDSGLRSARSIAAALAQG